MAIGAGFSDLPTPDEMGVAMKSGLRALMSLRIQYSLGIECIFGHQVGI